MKADLNKFYVYQYTDPEAPGKVVYIGKGCGRRAWDHLGASDNIQLFDWLCELQQKGIEIEPQMVSENLSQIEALTLEKTLIERYGRFEQGTGTLFNLSSGGPGTSYGTGEQIEINGFVYPSKRAAARAYNVHDVTFHTRLKKGWTPEQAVGITSPPSRARPKGRAISCEGVEHSSLTRFAEKLDKPRELVKGRLKRGWTPEQAVELVPPPTGSNVPQQITCNGRDFRSAAALAKYYEQPDGRVRRLLKKGLSPEIAAGLEPEPGCIICDGKQFKSIRALSRHYKKPREYIRRRRLRGLSWEEAVR